MATLSNYFDKALAHSTLSGIVACAATYCCLNHIEHFYDLTTKSSLFSNSLLCFSCCFSSFSTARLVYRFFLDGQPTSRISPAAITIFASAIGTLLAPFVAGFPPYAAFACRLNCPEALYYPRLYSAPRKNNAANTLSLEDLLSLLEVLLLFGLGISASSMTPAFEEGGAILLCILISVAASALLCLRYFKRCREEIPKTKMIASVFFRCMWLAFWFFLLTLTPFWQFIIERGF